MATLLVVPVLLLVVGAAAALLRLWPVTGLCLALAVAWPGARLVQVDEGTYAVGLLTGPLWTPTLMALCVPGRRLLPWTLAAVVVVAGWTRALTYEPFLDASCHQYCLHNPLAGSPDLRIAHAAYVTGLAFIVAAWLATLRHTHAHLLGKAVALISVVAGLASVGGTPEQPPALVTVAQFATAVGAVVVAALLVIGRAGLLRRLSGVRDALTRGTDLGAATLLADALRDPRVLVGYPVDAGGFVDRRGLPLGPPEAGRRRIALLNGTVEVGVIELAESIPEHVVRGRVGPAMLTALHNEGLERRLEHQVQVLADSRRDLVDHLDSERSRLERDLHDGAQQEILGLAMQWRALREAALERGACASADIAAEAEQTTALLLSRLRDVARGIHPAVLDGGGLEPALRHLADSAPKPFLVSMKDCGSLPEMTVRTVYAVVRDATLGRVDEIEVFRDRDLVLRVTTTSPMTETIEDRAAASGGWARVTPNGWEVRLPCA